MSSCTTDLKRADTFFENGNYEDAIEMYERVLKRSPDEVDARVGLKRSREAWLSDQLIEVRLLRLAGNTKQSAAELNRILEREIRWQTFPTGAATFTQEEETQYAARSVLIDARAALKASQTLKASYLLNKNRAFYQAERERPYAEVEGLARVQGQADCAKLKLRIRANDYYFGLFTQKYCQLYGAKGPDLKNQAKRESANLYSKVDLELITPMPGPVKDSATSFVQSMSADLFQKDFEATPWFDPSGSNHLKLRTEAKFATKHETFDRILTHNYTVQVPYEVTHTERRAKTGSGSSSSSSNSSFFDGLGGALGAVSAVASAAAGTPQNRRSHDNDDETVTVTETKYRSEPRSLDYRATEHVQTLSLSFRSSGALAGDPIEALQEKIVEHRTYESQAADSSIGLQAQVPDYISENEWLKSQIQIASSQMKERALSTWDRKFCSDTTKKAGTDFSPDQIFRCWKSRTGKLPVAFSNWFAATFGVLPDEGEELLGLTH